MVEALAKTEDLEGPSLTDDVAEGLTNDLLLVAFALWLLGLWICSRHLPFLVALVMTSESRRPVLYTLLGSATALGHSWMK